MDEEWKRIREFPGYHISTYGRIFKESDGMIMKTSYTQQGDEKVGLWMNGKQHTRSVKVLVAKAFVDKESPKFDTPIHLDGVQSNNRADNLAWRPRWFAVQFKLQFQQEMRPSMFARPVWNVTRDIVYENIVLAAMMDGVLIRDIVKSVNEEEYKIYPNGDVYTHDF